MLIIFIVCSFSITSQKILADESISIYLRISHVDWYYEYNSENSIFVFKFLIELWNPVNSKITIFQNAIPLFDVSITLPDNFSLLITKTTAPAFFQKTYSPGITNALESVSFGIANYYSNNLPDGQFDFILSNPFYIPNNNVSVNLYNAHLTIANQESTILYDSIPHNWGNITLNFTSNSLNVSTDGFVLFCSGSVLGAGVILLLKRLSSI